MAIVDIYEKLACPACRAPLNREQQTRLICTSCQRTYSYEKGIPVMLDEESESELRQYMQTAENRRLHQQLAAWPRVYAALRRLRPPHPFLNVNAGQRRAKFSKLVEEVSDAPAILDIGSGNTGLSNVAGLTKQVQGGLISLEVCYAPQVQVIGDA